ncbi:MAG: hypothetical protein ABR589_00475 [Chthoniobacterales bacterium]
MKITLSLTLAAAFALTGCSMFSKEGRQQRRYEKYVRKSSVARQKQRSILKGSKTEMPPQPMPSEPMESTEVSPQAMPREDSQ